MTTHALILRQQAQRLLDLAEDTEQAECDYPIGTGVELTDNELDLVMGGVPKHSVERYRATRGTVIGYVPVRSTGTCKVTVKARTRKSADPPVTVPRSLVKKVNQ